jgi:hypothetical protein
LIWNERGRLGAEHNAKKQCEGCEGETHGVSYEQIYVRGVPRLRSGTGAFVNDKHLAFARWAQALAKRSRGHAFCKIDDARAQPRAFGEYQLQVLSTIGTLLSFGCSGAVFSDQ